MNKSGKKEKGQSIIKNKEPILFEQRFKDKINVVGKLGVLDLLGLHQPFNLQRAPTPIIQSQVIEQNAKIEKKDLSPRRLSYSEKDQARLNPQTKNAKQKANKTEALILVKKDRKEGLPRISKSSANILIDQTKGPRSLGSTKEYWGQLVANKNVKGRVLETKRAVSQLSCINILKMDLQANGHFQNLIKFEKTHKTSVKISKNK